MCGHASTRSTDEHPEHDEQHEPNHCGQRCKNRSAHRAHRARSFAQAMRVVEGDVLELREHGGRRSRSLRDPRRITFDGEATNGGTYASKYLLIRTVVARLWNTTP